MKRAIMGVAAAAGLLSGCNSGLDNSQQDPVARGGFRDNLSPGELLGDQSQLVDPTVDYSAALRAAAVRLTGNYPTLAEIKQMKAAKDPPTIYGQLIDGYLLRPAFAAEQMNFWRDTMRLVGSKSVAGQTVGLDGAPAFAASLVVAEGPMTQLFTAQKGTCPTFNAATGSFSAADCPGGGAAVGVLTDPGMNSQFYSSMAFRRTRWTVETFLCQKFPVETGGPPQARPGGTYSSPWPMKSISGGTGARVDFLDDSNLVCANCHTTLNHIAPLLGHFDEAGRPTTGFGVVTPIAGNPTSVMTDWLPVGEGFAWRYGQPVKDLPALGQAIAADPGFATCLATRTWNWAFGRGDAVVDQATLTADVAAQLTDTLTKNNYNMKKLIRQVFTSASFVRF